MSSTGSAIAVATASPAAPALHAAYINPQLATNNERIEIRVPAAENARAISRIPSPTAIATRRAKSTRAYANVSHTKAIKERLTSIEGRSLRPALAFIASLIECRSDTSDMRFSNFEKFALLMLKQLVDFCHMIAGDFF